jgi:hypothetical protein
MSTMGVTTGSPTNTHGGLRDIAVNDDATSEVILWRCITAGVPGTWLAHHSPFSLQAGGYIDLTELPPPVYLGQGVKDTSSNITGWNAPWASSRQVATIRISNSTLTGTGNLTFSVVVNGSESTIGTTPVSSPGDISASLSIAIAATDPISFKLAGAGVTGGHLTARLLLACR